MPSLVQQKLGRGMYAVEYIEDKTGGVWQSRVERNRERAMIMQFGYQIQRIGGFGEKGCGN
jgi:hypothetical protein